MTKKITILIIGFLVLTMISIQAEDKFNVEIFAIRGPEKTTAGFKAWGDSVVSSLYAYRTLGIDTGYQLYADYVTEPADLSNNILWFAVRVTSRNPSDKFSLKMLRFVETSDMGNALGSSYAPGASSVYSKNAVGVSWDASGHRLDGTVLSNGQDGDTLVNELCFIGLQTTYFYPYSVQTVIAELTKLTDFSVNVKCSIVNSAGSTLAWGQRTLTMNSVPTPTKLSVKDLGDSIQISVEVDLRQTAVVQFTESLVPINWKTEATVNAVANTIVRPKASQGFYRVLP